MAEGCWSAALGEATTLASFELALADCVTHPLPAWPNTRVLTLAQGQTQTLGWKLEQAGCWRLFAASDQIAELALGLRSGPEVIWDKQHGPLAALNPDGPLCLSPGSYAVLVRAERGAGRAWIQAVTARLDAGSTAPSSRARSPAPAARAADD